MKIVHADEVIPVDHPVFLLFGQPGICKSSLGYSAKDPLTLDFDRGAHRAANRKDTLVIDTWADVAELMKASDALTPYHAIIVDTVGRCLDVMTADIIRETPKLGPNGNLSQQGWGTLKNRFRQWMSTLRALGKDVILIAHDKEDKDGDTRIVRPDIVGGSYSEVMKVADLCGYVYMAGKDRILDFNPTDRWIGKNPAGWAPFKIPPVEKATTFMADLLDRARAALGAISEESAKVTVALEEWRDRIAGFKSAAEFNKAIPEVKHLSAILAPQVSKMLLDVAPSAGVTFDKSKKAFFDAPKTVAEQEAVGSLLG